MHPTICTFCNNRGYIPAGWLGIDMPCIAPEINDIAGIGKTVTITEHGIPCPLCKFDEVTKEQFALFLSVVERQAIKRDERAIVMYKENAMLKREASNLSVRVARLESEIEELINSEEED